MAGNQDSVEIAIQRIYIKDLSFESPGAPDIFKSQFQPKIQIDIETSNKELQSGLFEVSLTITATANTETKTIFIAEIEQAGIFAIKGASTETLKQILHIYCPTALFPYARETIDSMTTKGSLPPLMLAPINFEGLYHQQEKKEEK